MRGLLFCRCPLLGLLNLNCFMSTRDSPTTATPSEKDVVSASVVAVLFLSKADCSTSWYITSSRRSLFSDGCWLCVVEGQIQL